MRSSNRLRCNGSQPLRNACNRLCPSDRLRCKGSEGMPEIHCGDWDYAKLVRAYLWITRFPQVSHCLALHPVTFRAERMYYRVRSPALQRVWVISGTDAPRNASRDGAQRQRPGYPAFINTSVPAGPIQSGGHSFHQEGAPRGPVLVCPVAGVPVTAISPQPPHPQGRALPLRAPPAWARSRPGIRRSARPQPHLHRPGPAGA